MLAILEASSIPKELFMLRKLILLAITSGLAKKGYQLYKARQRGGTPTPRHVTDRRDLIMLNAVPAQHGAPIAGDAG
jgi:hypothetical protein